MLSCGNNALNNNISSKNTVFTYFWELYNALTHPQSKTGKIRVAQSLSMLLNCTQMFSNSLWCGAVWCENLLKFVMFHKKCRYFTFHFIRATVAYQWNIPRIIWVYMAIHIILIYSYLPEEDILISATYGKSHLKIAISMKIIYLQS